MFAIFSAVRLFLGKLPSWVYKLAAILLIAFALIQYGEHRVQVKWDAEKATNKSHATVVVAQQEAVTSKVEADEKVSEAEIKTVFKDRIIYKDRVVTHETIVKEDAACTIPERFISMWNSANSGEVPTTSSNTDATPSRSGTVESAR